MAQAKALNHSPGGLSRSHEWLLGVPYIIKVKHEFFMMGSFMKLQLQHHKIKHKIFYIQLGEKIEEFVKVVLTRIGFNVEFNQIMGATIILRIMLSAIRWCLKFSGIIVTSSLSFLDTSELLTG